MAQSTFNSPFPSPLSSETHSIEQKTLESGSWVRLLEKPNHFSFEEALLLCEISDREWLTWIPNYGQQTLNLRQFVASGENLLD